MAVDRTRNGDNVIYKITGVLDAESAHQYLDMNAQDYNEIGDALGAIIDFRQMSTPTIGALRVVQQRLSGVTFDTPVAFIGNPESILMTFLRGLEALTSRGRNRFSFFTRMEDAQKWIDGWYNTHHKDRDALRGQVTTLIRPREHDN